MELDSNLDRDRSDNHRTSDYCRLAWMLTALAVGDGVQQLRQLGDIRRDPPRFVAVPTSDGGSVARAVSRYLPQCVF